MQRHPSRHTAVAGALAALLSCGAAHADQAAALVHSVSPSQIEVQSNGSAYTTTVIPLASITADVGVHLDAGASGRVRSWSAWLTGQVDGGAVVQFSSDKISRSYGTGDRPKEVHQRHPITASSTVRSFAVAQCNAMATRLRNQGQSNSAIFAQDRSLPFTVAAMASADFSGVGGQGGSPVETIAPVRATIVCKQSEPHRTGSATPTADPAPVHGIAIPPALMAAMTIVVQPQPSPTPVACPAELTATMTFRADGRGPNGQPRPPGHFSYHVQAQSGKASQTRQVVFQESDRDGANYYKTIVQKFTVGGPGGMSGMGGAGPQGQQTAGGFASNPNLHADALRIVIDVAQPGGATQSAYAPYSITCQAPAAAAPVQPAQVPTGQQQQPVQQHSVPAAPLGKAVQPSSPANMAAPMRKPTAAQ